MNKCDYKVSTSVSHAKEWGCGCPKLLDLSPALRSTDYKCPHWVWIIDDEMNETAEDTDKIGREKGSLTGGVRLAKMLNDGKIGFPWLWIDTYNGVVNDIAGTIKLRIDTNNCYYVSVLENE